MNTTADSNLTKRALAAAMKELMEQMPFSKISVSDIAEQCGMNRKSFYYHFKDKYDLVNWIFDMEYLAVFQPAGLCRDLGFSYRAVQLFLRKPLFLPAGAAH